MKTRLMMFVAVIALFVFNGCSDSKESYVKDFKKFIERWKQPEAIIQKKTGRKPMKSSKLLLVTVMRSSVPN